MINQEKKELLNFIESIPNYVLEVDAEGKIIYLNRASQNPDISIIGKYVFDFLDKRYIKRYRDAIERALKEDKEVEIEVKTKTINGVSDWYNTKVFPLHKENNIDHVAISSVNISRHKEIEKLLKDRQKEYRYILSMLPDYVTITDLNGKIKFMNKTDLNENENMDKPVWQYVTPDEVEKIKTLTLKIAKDGKPIDYETTTQHGKLIIYWETRIYRVKHGKNYRLIFISTDISKRKQNERKILDSLKEKEILLKELNHRIKNNLQVISSISYFTFKNVNDNEISKQVEDFNLRIRSMAFIHEFLYNSNNVVKINLNDYVLKIIQHNLISYGVSRHQIEINVKIEDHDLELEQASCCSLIVNEAVSNLLKHAFPKENHGKFDVHFYKKQKLHYLVITDNGVGLPDNLDTLDKKHIGINLMKLITGQLGGKFEISSDSGTHIKVIF